MSIAPRLYRLALRQVRVGAGLVTLGLFALTWVTVRSYEAVGEARIVKQLAPLLKNPAIGALYGHPYAITNAGGFTVWKSGSMIAEVVAIWAALAITRLTRGAEDSGAFDQLVIGHGERWTATLAALGAVMTGAWAAGGAVALGFLVGHLSVSSSILYGVGVALCGSFAAALSLVVCQLFAPRRVATAVVGATVGALYVIRMIADATSSLSGLRWVTPFGWLEECRAFGATQWSWLLLIAAAAAGFAFAALAVLARRDIGRGVVSVSDTARLRHGGLRSALGFALRNRITLLVAWAVGVGAMSMMLGGLLKSIVKFASSNAQYVKILQQYGFGDMVTPRGFLAQLGTLFAIAFSLLAIVSLNHERSDEDDGRLEITLATGPSRSAWLGASLGATAIVVLVVVTLSGLAIDLGASLGGASIPLGDALSAQLNAASVVLVFLGVYLLAHGAWPRLALALSCTVLMASYIVDAFGRALHWPRWVIDLSVFHHVALVPIRPVSWSALAVTTVVAIALGTLGVAGFARRDLAA